MPVLPLIVLVGYNSVMVPGVDTPSMVKEVLATLKVRWVEGSVLTGLSLEDAWVHLHGERWLEAVQGFTFPTLQRRIDRIHLSISVSRMIWSVHPSGPQSGDVANLQDPEDALRFRFPLEMLIVPGDKHRLQKVLATYEGPSEDVVGWGEGVCHILRVQVRTLRKLEFRLNLGGGGT